ncbi:uncharacterized protein CIMG_02810 [Coccidioides immitis RS]|uniref:Cellobiose dehydrogenase n=2 Tax=Coccidioides immitis TaxID=5501 RepID=J3KM59_COCIM|nr:uncharacterized protein CIMG_02810 [Coccidioides immitis RS]EAS37456.3 hypothetical protein CIMG_02810 [Coccidioides immitis RS]KMU90083.1 hypothetical protein CIHG_07893 [Coccidioides immitis H538.4]TPX24653.1 hypothetical protein DIZ76_010085 [Coccidioides immitis]
MSQRRRRWLLLPHISILAWLVCLSAAAKVQFCKSNEDGSVDLCLALASYRNGTSNSNDVYLHLSSKFTGRRGWAAFGTGTGMDGSMMFIFYPGEREGDVTLSVRSSSGHLPPEAHPELPSHEVIQTSVDAHYHDVHVICYACDGWPGKKIKVDTDHQPWIWATHTSQVMQTADVDHRLEYHGHHGHGGFYLNMADGRSASFPRTNLKMLMIDRGSVHPEDPQSNSESIRRFLFQVHGFVLAVVFTLIMPLGVGFIRQGGESAFSRHWVVQASAVIGAVGGMSIALLISKKLIQLGDAHGTHKLIGICLLLAILVQPCIGYWHHLAFLKLKRRTSVTYAHIYFGRAVLMLAWLNIALGLYIAHVPFLIWLAWIACMLLAIVGMLRLRTASRLFKRGKRNVSITEYELVDGDEISPSQPQGRSFTN